MIKENLQGLFNELEGAVKNRISNEALNIFLYDDNLKIQKVSKIEGINFLSKNNGRKIFITHKSNRFINCKIYLKLPAANCFIAKSRFLINGLMADFDNKSELFIGNDFSCGPTEIRLREHKNVYIGSDCMFSSEITIWTSDGHAIFNEEGVCINKGGDVVCLGWSWCKNIEKFINRRRICCGWK